ncbi:MAG: hypothetical protein ACRDJB_03645 [Actinomycetota bacterium]
MEIVWKLRFALAALVAVGMSACSTPGVNAGEQGGRAFILFAAMLVVTGAVLAYFLGKED